MQSLRTSRGFTDGGGNTDEKRVIWVFQGQHTLRSTSWDKTDESSLLYKWLTLQHDFEQAWTRLKRPQEAHRVLRRIFPIQKWHTRKVNIKKAGSYVIAHIDRALLFQRFSTVVFVLLHLLLSKLKDWWEFLREAMFGGLGSAWNITEKKKTLSFNVILSRRGVIQLLDCTA